MEEKHESHQLGAQSIESIQVENADGNANSTWHLTNKDDSSDIIEPCGGFLGLFVAKYRLKIKEKIKIMCGGVGIYLKWIISCILLTSYFIYISYVWIHSDCDEINWSNGYGLAIIVFCFIFCGILNKGIHYFLKKMNITFEFFTTKNHVISKINSSLYWMILIPINAIFIMTIAYEGFQESRRLVSLAGYFIIIALCFLCSKRPTHVNWKTISCGFTLQIGLSLFFIKLDHGRKVLEVIGKKVESFLGYSFVGARFVYGDVLIDSNSFAFKSLSVIFFMAMIVNVLFYYGIIQVVCFKLGRILQFFLDTTVIESVNAVASIFLGMAESPLLFKPYLEHLTPSEIHAMMTSGLGTVAGTVLAAYVSFGAKSGSLISATTMAAPASLAFAKLLYPETRKTKTSSNNIIIVKSDDLGVVDAACKGALLGVDLVFGIISCIIACISFIAFANALISWLGLLAGVPDLSFEGLLGIVFIPVAWLLGVTPSDCERVGRLIGVKTVVNEFVAYKEMGEMKRKQLLTPRSEAIATFALCSFANPASVAILIAMLSSLCPEQRDTAVQLAFSAFIAGTCTSLTSACIAGMLIPEGGFIDAPLISEPLPFGNNSTCLL